MNNFIINQDSAWWTGLGDRLLNTFPPYQSLKDLSAIPSKRFSPQVLACRLFLYSVSQPQPGPSTKAESFPMSFFMALLR